MPEFNIDLHNHCNCDKVDMLDYSDFELIDRALEKGIHVLAITPHGEVYHHPEAVRYAQERGLLLIPGVEKLIDGKEVVLLNVSPEEVPAKQHFSFRDLEHLRSRRGDSMYVIAPHPFYPRKSCLGTLMDDQALLIDSVEYAHLYTCFYDVPNRKAVAWAKRYGKTVIASSDAHSLDMVARNHSSVQAEHLVPESIFRAMKQGPVRLTTKPYTLVEALWIFGRLVATQEYKRFRRNWTRMLSEQLSP